MRSNLSNKSRQGVLLSARGVVFGIFLYLLTCGIWTKLLDEANAQVFVPPENKSSGKATSRGNSGTNNTTIINKKQKSNSGGRIGGNEIPLVDPSNEAITWEGNTWMIEDNRLMRARFERYLNEKANNSKQDREYRKILQRILQILSPNYKKRDDGDDGIDLLEAVRLLPEAAEYIQDAGLSNAINNAVFDAYNALLKRDRLEDSIVRHKQELDNIHFEKMRKMGLHLSNSKLDSAGTLPGKGKRAAANAKGQTLDSARFTEDMRYSLMQEAEKRALIVEKSARAELSVADVILSFQTTIVQLLMQRRWEHALIAARLYSIILLNADIESKNKAFEDKRNRSSKSREGLDDVNRHNIQLKEGSDMAKIFSETIGMNPTISAVEAFCYEVIGDVEKGVDAFRLLASKNELNAAAERLAEAYFMGEYLSPIRTLTLKEKRPVQLFVRDAYMLVNAFDSKDFEKAEKILNKLNNIAKDFDGTKIRSAVNSIRIVANMHIVKAQEAVVRGDVETANDSYTLATELWPSNPRLKSSVDEMFTRKGTLNRLRDEFFQLHSAGRYSDIMQKFGEFSAASVGDVEMTELLREVSEKRAQIAYTLQSAKSLHQNGNSYAAWETLELMREKYPKDPELALQQVEIAKHVIQFAKALEKARKMEDDEQYGSSLAWYLRAREYYPRSSYAQKGIKNLSDRIFGDESAEITASSEELIEL